MAEDERKAARIAAWVALGFSQDAAEELWDSFVESQRDVHRYNRHVSDLMARLSTPKED